MTQNPQRFSGRELGLLLSQVRDELGEDATIIEANRLREGGLAGFFAKERFEVLATAVQPTDEPVHADGGFAAGSAVSAGAAAGLVGHLLDRAEQISGDERRAARPGVATATGDGRPIERPPAGTAPSVDGLDGPGVTDARFDEILRGALADLATGDHPESATTPEAAFPPMAAPARLSPDAPAAPAPLPPPPPPPPPPPHIRPVGPSTAPIPPAPPAAPPARPAAASARPAGAPTRDLRSLPGGAFWDGLVRFEELLDDLPLTADVTTVVGPLGDAVAVARHLARQAGIDSGDLVVVTDRRQVDGVPPWQVVDRRDDLADRVRYWRANGRRALVVVELEDGERGLDRTARTVEAAAGDLTRLVVPGLDDPAGLATTLRGLGPVTAIDVSRPPRPERLVEAVEQGVRIGTVCGRPLTAMLLAGLAGTVHHG